MGTVVLSVPTILGCNDRPQRLNPPAVQFTDFRQVQSNPEAYFGQTVRCKMLITPEAPRDTFFPYAHFAADLDHATKIGRVMCEPDSHFVNVLVQPQEMSRYFAIQFEQVVPFTLLKDRDTRNEFALRFQ